MIATHHSTTLTSPQKTRAAFHAMVSQMDIRSILKNAGVSDDAADRAAAGYIYAEKKKDGNVNPNVMAVVDFSMASNHKRLYVVNLKTGQLIDRYYVAHGSNSGGRYATHFSNAMDSHESSLGVFTVGASYYGAHGLSRHMIGLEPGINDNAERRDVELHRANYVSSSWINKYYQAGHTWGCFGISPEKADTIIHELPTNTVLFAYASPENQDSNLS